MPRCARRAHRPPAGRVHDRPRGTRRAGPEPRQAPRSPGPPRDRSVRTRPRHRRDEETRCRGGAFAHARPGRRAPRTDRRVGDRHLPGHAGRRRIRRSRPRDRDGVRPGPGDRRLSALRAAVQSRRRGPGIPHQVIDPRGRRAVGRRGRDRDARSGGAPAVAGPGQPSGRASRWRCALLPVPPGPVRVPQGRARAPGARYDDGASSPRRRLVRGCGPTRGRDRACAGRCRSGDRGASRRCDHPADALCGAHGSARSLAPGVRRRHLRAASAPRRRRRAGERRHREGRGRGATGRHRRTLDVRRKPWRRFRVIRVCTRDPAGGHGSARSGRHARERPVRGRGRAGEQPVAPDGPLRSGRRAHPAR